MVFFCVDPNDELEPGLLYLWSASLGNISGMETALEADPKLLFTVDIFEKRSALHHAVECSGPNGIAAVKWLLEKGIPWSTVDGDDLTAEQVAQMRGNEESRKFLREWALRDAYELFYKSSRHEDSPDYGKQINCLKMDKTHPDSSKEFCNSCILYLNPNGSPEDEVALVCDPEGTGIMMEWERPIMRESARRLLDGMPKSGLRVLNIGFGLGMIDTYFQDAHPAEHVIIEGHPVVIGWMRRNGWHNRPGVLILNGRWQDFLEAPASKDSLKLLKDGDKGDGVPFDIGKFDVVYFDTFGEGYRGHVAFIKHVPRLLRGPESRFSYFVGHGAKHGMLYEVYAEVQKMHHNDLGLNTTYTQVHIDKTTMWTNIKSRGRGEDMDYPHLVPICQLAPTVPLTIVKGVGWNAHPMDRDEEEN